MRNPRVRGILSVRPNIGVDAVTDRLGYEPKVIGVVAGHCKVVLPQRFRQSVPTQILRFRVIRQRVSRPIRSPEEVQKPRRPVPVEDRRPVRVPHLPRLRIHSASVKLLGHAVEHFLMLSRCLQVPLLQLLRQGARLSRALLIIVQTPRAKASNGHVRRLLTDLPIVQSHADLSDPVVQLLHVGRFRLVQLRLMQPPLKLHVLLCQDRLNAPLLHRVLGLNVTLLRRVLRRKGVLVLVPLVLVEGRLIALSHLDVAKLIRVLGLIPSLVGGVHGLIDRQPVIPLALIASFPMLLPLQEAVQERIAISLLPGLLEVDVELILRVLVVVDLLLLGKLNGG